MTAREALHAHLAQGITTTCHAWAIRRKDGTVYGFTDHDRDLEFDGIVFQAGTGLTARALQQTSGLAVDNSEAMGALSDLSLTEADLMAGRFDGADLSVWQVNWADPSQRVLRFRGMIGEIQRAGGAFRAELRGLAELLNQPQGRSYQRGCAAILGDAACRVDLSRPGLSYDVPVIVIEDSIRFRLPELTDVAGGWFERGRVEMLTGAAAGLTGVVRRDRLDATGRVIELWQRLGAPIADGDLLRVVAGCDKTVSTCRFKFANFLNFRGFPHIPGEDWLTAYPASGGLHDGGSLMR
ncbi:DUF2163 domain-containing protein [Szabonella alba]|uniref:DUF2163 domain-containing protein n=1 Tax=Szabonella alba TaxID=2804194 RepID=A0A8K0Y1L9_9RHOB|nr:DUF2163 domain-containing protein [Szabonella alba]MBL4918288.1 DUF2163 domain-containing protein [Szabonella alba]